MTKLVLVSLLVALGAGCKQPARSTGAGGVAADFPERVGSEGDATVSRKVGIFGAGGGDRITIDLERAPANGSANLWACWGVPADTFTFGRAVCVADPHKTVEITAAAVELTCRVNPEFGVVKAKAPLSRDFCDAYEVFAYEFQPQLEVRLND